MRVAVYPGTFDPITLGHTDIVERALKLFDKVIIAVAASAHKSPRWSLDKRLRVIKKVFEGDERVQVQGFQGLLVNFVREQGAVAIVRGIRAVGDFEYEFQLAGMNHVLAPEFETVFLLPKPSHIMISSTIVREIVQMGGDISAFVPKSVLDVIPNE